MAADLWLFVIFPCVLIAIVISEHAKSERQHLAAQAKRAKRD